MNLTLPHNWSPRPYQVPLWNYLCAGGKRAVACWPRRHGKDDVGLEHTACAMPERKGTYWYLLPEYAQARKAVWDAIDEETGTRRIDQIFPTVARTLYREQEMILGMGGSTIQVVGADNYNSLVGSPPVGVVFSEYARTNPLAWSYIMPIVEKNGGWAYFNSTPYGDNHFKGFCEYAAGEMQRDGSWFYDHLTADTCGVYSPAQLAKIKEQYIVNHGEDYGTAIFLQEYYCSFDASLPGAIFADCLLQAQQQGRVYPFAVDRNLPVHTAWDLGRTDDTAIWFYQILGGEILIFDYHASSLKDIPFYVELLEAKRDEHRIRYGRHWLPHDAKPRHLAAGAGSMMHQFAEAARRNPRLGMFALAKGLDLQEQIQATRTTLPLCRFHDTRCALGLKSLKHYHREWDEEKKVFLATPRHDWSSHAASAMMTLSLTWRKEQSAEPEPDPRQILTTRPTMAHVVAQHFEKRKHQREWSGMRS